MRHYATVCHARQLPVLLASMRKHCGDFLLHVLAWDWAIVNPVHRNMVITGRHEFLQRHPDYHPDRLPGPPRRPVDEVVTMRWRFFADVMEATGEPLTAIDGDLFFFSSPEPLFTEIPTTAPLAVSPHRIPPAAAGLPGVTLETHRCYGLYNAGFVFLRDPAVAREMAELNKAWSYTEVVPRPRGGWLFGDQGWLEEVANRRGAHVIEHPGVNVAPWNIHTAHLRTFTPAGGPPLPPSYTVVGPDLVPLIAYHFSSFRLAGLHWANAEYEVERAPGAIELLYRPYARACSGANTAALRGGVD